MALDEFNKLIGQRIKELLPVQTVWAVCKSVDWESKTMTATGQSDSLDYEDVSLGVGWQYLKPKVKTICLLGIEENNPANAFLIDAFEIEEMELKDATGFKLHLKAGKLTINGDAYSGLVKAPELKQQLDKNTAILQMIQEVFTNWVAVPNDGGAALKTLAAQFTSLVRADLSNIENENIKHG